MDPETAKSNPQSGERSATATVVGFHAPLQGDVASPPSFQSIVTNATNYSGQLIDGLPTGFTDVPGYDVYEFVGRGANAIVYRARQRSLHRVVALKFLLSRNFRDVARFRAEAEAVAKLHHPNIVQIHEIGEHRGFLFLALEFVNGGRLQELMAQNPIDPRDAARLCLVMANAIHYAHSQGIVHRDLKPSNILLDLQKEPKIVDFGIAKRDSQDQTFTQDGELIGTPAYMAPEQARGDIAQINPTTDVYALGVVLYEMLTGSRPFVAPSTAETLHKVLQDDPIRPSRIQHSIPIDMETICLKCLEKDSNRRYSSAAALASDLQRFLDDIPISARRTSMLARLMKWGRRRPAVAALSLVAILATISALGGLTLGMVNARRLASSEKIAGEKQTILREEAEATLYSSRIAQADLMADKGVFNSAANILDLCRPKNQERDLRGWEWSYVYRLLNSELSRYHCERWVHKVAYSPDGRWLAAATGYPENYSGSSEESRTPGAIWIWETQTGALKQKVAPHATSIMHVEFSPDSKWVLSRELLGEFCLTNVDSGKKFNQVFPSESVLKFACGGETLVAMDKTRSLQLWSLRDEKLTATLRAAKQGNSFAAAPNVEIVLFDKGSSLCEVNGRTGTLLRTLATNGKAIDHLKLSGNGKRCCYLKDRLTVCAQDLAKSEPYFQRKMDSIVGIGNTLSDSGRFLFFHPKTGEVTLIDTENPTQKLEFRNGASAVFFKDSLFATTLGVGPTEVFELPSMHRVSALAYRFDGGITDWKLSPDGKFAAASGHNGKVSVWDISSGENKVVLMGHEGGVKSFSFHPTERKLASAGQDGTVRVWDLEKRQRIERLTTSSPQGGEYLGNIWMDDKAENVFVIYHARPMLRRIERATGKVFEQAIDATKTFVFPRFDSAATRKGDLFIVAKGSEPNALAVIDSMTGKEIQVLRGHTAEPRDVAISGDGTIAASFVRRAVEKTLVSKELILWNVKTGAQLLNRQIEFNVSALALSEDGKVLSLIGNRYFDAPNMEYSTATLTVQVLSVPDGKEIFSWSGEPQRYVKPEMPNMVLASTLDFNGRLLVAGEFQTGRIRVWDLHKKAELFTQKPIYSQKSVTSISFNPSGNRFAIHNYFGVISVWNPETGEKMITLQSFYADGRTDDMGFSGKVIFSADGNLILASNWMGTIDLWDGTPKEGAQLAHEQTSLAH